MQITLLSSMLFILYFCLSIMPACNAEDTGTANAPLIPADKVVKTVCSSGCDYRTPQAAMNAASAGWTIQIRNGTYAASSTSTPILQIAKAGTEAQPITVENYPGEHPVLECNGIPNGSTSANNYNNGVTLVSPAQWIIVEGLEIRGCWWGIRVHTAPYVTIRNNIIHHNKEIGISTAFNHDLYIADNEIYHDGTMEGNPGYGCPYYHAFCHGIYLGGTDTNDPNCLTKTVTIRRNYIHDHSGWGAHIWSGNSCLQTDSTILIENNLFIDNATGGFEFSRGYLGNTARNNTVALINPPAIRESPYTHYYALAEHRFGLAATPQNKIYNNIYYASANSYSATGTSRPLWVLITDSANDNAANLYDYNLWYVPPRAKWIDKVFINGGTVRDFASTYKTTMSGGVADRHGPTIPTDPLFTDIRSRNLRLNWSSPAIDAGDISNAPTDDFDRKLRDFNPDIGAFEY